MSEEVYAYPVRYMVVDSGEKFAVLDTLTPEANTICTCDDGEWAHKIYLAMNRAEGYKVREDFEN